MHCSRQEINASKFKSKRKQIWNYAEQTEIFVYTSYLWNVIKLECFLYLRVWVGRKSWNDVTDKVLCFLYRKLYCLNHLFLYWWTREHQQVSMIQQMIYGQEEQGGGWWCMYSCILKTLLNYDCHVNKWLIYSKYRDWCILSWTHDQFYLNIWCKIILFSPQNLIIIRNNNGKILLEISMKTPWILFCNSCTNHVKCCN